METKAGNKGMTLIEIMVVMILISLMLFFTIPNIQSWVFSGDSRDVTRWLTVKVKVLKENALIDQKTYILHINFDAEKFFITNEAMSEEEAAKAMENGFSLPETIRVADVEYPGGGIVTTGETEIYFYPRGYSDGAIIHVMTGENEYRSYIIEPFLNKLKTVEGYYRVES